CAGFLIKALLENSSRYSLAFFDMSSRLAATCPDTVTSSTLPPEVFSERATVEALLKAAASVSPSSRSTEGKGVTSIFVSATREQVSFSPVVLQLNFCTTRGASVHFGPNVTTAQYMNFAFHSLTPAARIP